MGGYSTISPDVSKVWTVPTRTLTDVNNVWSAPIRNLTDVSNIWTHGTRTLTDVSNIWSYTTRALTDVSNIRDAVWNATTRTLTNVDNIKNAVLPTATETLGADAAAATNGTILTSGAINTKGSYVQLTAATTINAKSAMLHYCNNASSYNRILLDLAIGAAGAENTLISNLFLATVQYPQPGSISFPLQIPAGTRISARIQASSASVNLPVTMTLLG
jgi:hypothetical protein